MSTRGASDFLLQAIFGGCFILAGVGILGYQAYTFLKYGEWPPLSVIDAAKLVINNPWLWSPTDWSGLHWILSKIPTSAALFGVGYVILVSE